MQLNQKIKGAFKGTFNVLSGKKGGRAAAAGYGVAFSASGTAILAAVLAVGTASAVLPAGVLAVVGLGATVSGARRLSGVLKKQGRQKGPKN